MTYIRVSVKAYLVPYLDAVGAELGTNDYTEVVNHLLRESKRRGASSSAPTSHSAPSTNDDALADSLLGLMPV